jgi:phage shock protein PspC (stress-responsive transcriptional regulator)
MNKTLSASIGGRPFLVEEDAYTRLHGYLRAIAAHFAAYPDAAEITADIESRIAEQLLLQEASSSVVLLTDVERVIGTMGGIEEFGDASAAPVEPRHDGRKLFLDPDNRIIAGVAAGLAAYLGLPPLAVRIALVLLLFFFGSAVVIYLLLWALLPVAGTTTEKLQMRGDPLTLSTIEQGVRNRLGVLPPHTRSAAARSVTATGSLLRMAIIGAVGVLKAAAGVLVAGGAALGLLLLTVLLVMALVNAGAPPLHPLVAEFFASFDAWQQAVKVFLYLILAIPLAVVGTVAFKLLRGISRINTRSLATLLGIWLFAVLASAGIWARHWPGLQERMLRQTQYLEARLDARQEAAGTFSAHSVAVSCSANASITSSSGCARP